MRRAAGVFAVMAIVLAGLALPAAQADEPWYPETPHDFSRLPFGGLFTPESGDNDRPLLVVYHRFDTVEFPAGKDAAWLADRMFGPTRSLAGYFQSVSVGDFIISPAAESQGTTNDGIVQVTTGTRAAWDEGWGPDGDLPAMLGSVVEAADAFVDFESFDRNEDERLDTSELLILLVHPSKFEGQPYDGNDDCAAKRSADGDTQADGVTLPFIEVGVGSSKTNVMSMIHETGHLAFAMRDSYHWGVGRFDLGGRTCGADEIYFGPGAWHRLHWGWGDWQVVTRDGYYDVSPQSTNGTAYILYDPDRGTEDYFVVEGRSRGVAGYDANVEDSGLAIWRMDESWWRRGPADGLPAEHLRPDGLRTVTYGGGGGIGAWDPSDARTPARDMNEPWMDGTETTVGVRGIRKTFNGMRAFLDVRGPGVLVDGGGIGIAPLLQERSSFVPVRIMNTGETPDSFTFSAASTYPTDWTITGDSFPMAPHQLGELMLRVTPGARTSSPDVEVRGVSTSDPSVETTDRFRTMHLGAGYADPGWSLSNAKDLHLAQGDADRFDNTIFAQNSSVEQTEGIWRHYHPNEERLHSSSDVDFFNGVLPFMRSSVPRLGDAPDCGTLTIENPLGDEKVLLSSSATVGVALTQPLYDRSDRLILHGPAAEASTRFGFKRTVTCPRSFPTFVDEIPFSFGERPKGGTIPRTLGALYQPEFEYRVLAQRLPPEAAPWLEAQREIRGLRSVTAMPCPGGFFPKCLGGPRAVFDVARPLDVARSGTCHADGCPDYFTFRLEDANKLDIVLGSDFDTSFKLFSSSQELIAEAVPMVVGSPDRIEVPFGPPNSGPPPAGTYPDPPSQTGRLSMKRLQADLQPGFYVLEVSGNVSGDFTVDYVSTLLDLDLDGVDDQIDNCVVVSNPGQSDIDADGIGDGCDLSTHVGVDVGPGDPLNTIRLKSRGDIAIGIVSTATFDARGLAVEGICFGDAEDPSQRSCREVHGSIHPEDLNGDGLEDVVVHFAVQETGIDPADRTACATVLSTGGFEAGGCDNLRVR